MSGRRKKTILRTVRLAQEMDDLIQADAHAEGISVNALINRMLTKYVEWDRHIRRFNFISIASETFKSLINEVDDRKIDDVAKDLGSKMPKSVTLFWFKKLDLKSLLETFDLFGKYSGLLSHEFQTFESNYVITFHHELGKKWTVFLKHFLSEAVRSTIGVSQKLRSRTMW